MHREVFVEKIKTMAGIAIEGYEWDISMDLDASIVATTSKLQDKLSITVIENTREEGNEEVFHIPQISMYPLAIRTSDKSVFDPPVYLNREGYGGLLVQQASVPMLVSFAAAFAELSKHSFRQYNLSCYPLLRKHFTLFCNESGYPDKIQMHHSQLCYAVVYANDESIVFVAKTKEVLEQVKDELQLATPKKVERVCVPYPSDFLHNSTLTDGVLSGYIPFPGYKEFVQVSYETDDREDIEPLVNWSASMIPQIESAIDKGLKTQIGHGPTEADYARLQDHLKLQAIDFYDDAIMLAFESIPAMREKRIFVQLTRDLEVEEITVES
jgi:hypothetical protein